MARKMSRPSRGPATTPVHTPPPGRSREINIKPIHLLITALVIVLVAAGLLVLTAYYENQPQTAAAPPASSGQGVQVQTGSGQVQQIPAGGGPIQMQPGQVVYPSGANRPDSTPEGFPADGPANAPVTILEFSDFQCPYCRMFAQDVLPKLREKYVSTGKVRIIWRDMAIRGPESEAAGAAALCAHEQGRFWAYHDLLYMRQQGQNEGAFATDKLKGFSTEVGRIQPELFNQCIDSGRYLPAVKASTQDGQNTLKLTGTPTFFVNGQKIEGDLGWEKWDDLLKTAAGG